MPGWVVPFTGLHHWSVTPSIFGVNATNPSLVSPICSREVIQTIHLCLTHCNTFMLHSFMTATLNPISLVCFHLQNHLLCSVSLMWDSLRPSCNGSLFVDINSLS